jgi:acyl carrier protein
MSNHDGSTVEECLTFIDETLAKLLGLDADARIDRKRPLEAMGLDSILAMDFLVVLEKRYGRLPESLFQDHANVEQLATFLHERSKTG